MEIKPLKVSTRSERSKGLIFKLKRRDVVWWMYTNTFNKVLKPLKCPASSINCLKMHCDECCMKWEENLCQERQAAKERRVLLSNYKQASDFVNVSSCQIDMSKLTFRVGLFGGYRLDWKCCIRHTLTSCWECDLKACPKRMVCRITSPQRLNQRGMLIKPR